ncbi:haloacid dehalogenase [Microtetraspora sp. NBRC 13810]|uniref:HAD family hydrolase n=1 Tax=Microtetraspora sp. NBRC 13810 TaxID=3030990 RepID=UPI0024A2923B|nr:HAD family hydrolase [Microtetraspora sp. NBRC 13810]GLW06458.1 haloacid dehalogenase [Microtetraspora sp. NBRC 13810]
MTGDGRHQRQVLIFDADDTLWENNIIFERVIGDFLDWMAHPTMSRAEVRTILDDIEAANSIAYGYGSKVFLRSLGECVARLRDRPASEDELRRIEELTAAFVEWRAELIPGVAATLAELHTRHDLLLLTKGDHHEQQRKIDVSGLAHHFSSIHIVPEKNAGAYRRIVAELDLAPATTWMIGNSPKSDIIPAREAGLNAVFIPHEHTWVLEHTDLSGHDGVLHLSGFSQLLEHF